MLWDWDGTLERIHHALYVAAREQAGREASPTAAIIDSQSAKGAVKGGLRLTRRATMRARRSRAASGTSLSDTLGLLLNVHVHPADVQDRDGAEALLREARRLFPFIERIFADAGYQGQKMEAPSPTPAPGILRSSAAATCTASSFFPNAGSSSALSPGSAATAAWRATSSVTLGTAAAFVRLAMIRLMLRRLSCTCLSGSARATKVIGAKVYAGDTTVGQIEDVLVDLDRRTVTALVLSVGGFLGVGEKLVAVPVDQVKVGKGKVYD